MFPFTIALSHAQDAWPGLPVPTRSYVLSGESNFSEANGDGRDVSLSRPLGTGLGATLWPELSSPATCAPAGEPSTPVCLASSTCRRQAPMNPNS